MHTYILRLERLKKLAFKNNNYIQHIHTHLNTYMHIQKSVCIYKTTNFTEIIVK